MNAGSSRFALRLTALGLLSALWLLPTTASAAERVAVVVSAENIQDTALAENLSEIALAKLAESSGELVGASELSRLLERTRKGESLTTCLGEAECLRHLRAVLAVASVVAGKLRREGTRVTLEFQLLEGETGSQRRRVSRTSSEGVTELIQATRECVDELLRPEPEARVVEIPVAPPVLTLPPRSLAPASASPSAPPLESPRSTGGLRTTAAYGSATMAALSISAAVVFGVLARQEPSGATRAEAQERLEQQRAFATTANVLWISSGALVALSALAFSPLGREAPSQ